LVRVAFETLGCKVNQAESNMYEEQARQLNWQVVDYADVADIYVVNTCTVTNEADRQSGQVARQGRRRNPDALMVVTGCAVGNRANTTHWVSLEGERTLFVPNAAKEELLMAVQEHLQRETLPIGWDLPDPQLAGNTRGYLKITDGCNHACAYCIIPQMRGSVRSVTPDEVVRRVSRAVERGYRELVLTGIHLGSYGRDLRTTLDQLIPRILAETDLYRLRLSSLDCVNITPALLETWRQSPRLCPHFHIPLQSGTDEMLRSMRRFYNLQTYISTIERIKEALPEASLATDLIVGFPGETEELFEQTVQVIETLPFQQIHVFPFSARHNTPAAALPQQVPKAVKKERLHRVLELVEYKRHSWLQSWLGREVEVIVEHESKSLPYRRGLTAHCLPVRFSAPGAPSNELLRLRVTAISSDGLALEGIPCRGRGNSVASHPSERLASPNGAL